MTGESPELVDVLLLNLPVEEFRRSQQYHDALFRELTLLSTGLETDGETVPARLVALVQELTHRYGGFSAEPESRLQEAVERNETHIDLHFQVPAEAKAAAIALARMLDETDEYCRSGDLLSLASPPDVRAFRTRYLDEFVRQIDGEPPRPWQQP